MVKWVQGLAGGPVGIWNHTSANAYMTRSVADKLMALTVDTGHYLSTHGIAGNNSYLIEAYF